MNSNYQHIHSQLQEKNIMLVAVSKTKPVEDILALYTLGQKDFGENKVQELREKYELLPKDIKWHMIGHLQKNKLKYIAGWVSLIQSVDSLQLLEEINKHAEKNNRIISCLLQIYIAGEETKFGFSEKELFEALNSDVYKNMKHVRIEGVMGMATNTTHENTIRAEFNYLHSLFKQVQKKYFINDNYFRHISMGMSSDYTIAIDEGSTMVRLGSILFGTR